MIEAILPILPEPDEPQRNYNRAPQDLDSIREQLITKSSVLPILPEQLLNAVVRMLEEKKRITRDHVRSISDFIDNPLNSGLPYVTESGKKIRQTTMRDLREAALRDLDAIDQALSPCKEKDDLSTVALYLLRCIQDLKEKNKKLGKIIHKTIEESKVIDDNLSQMVFFREIIFMIHPFLEEISLNPSNQYTSQRSTSSKSESKNFSPN